MASVHDGDVDISVLETSAGGPAGLHRACDARARVDAQNPQESAAEGLESMWQRVSQDASPDSRQRRGWRLTEAAKNAAALLEMKDAARNEGIIADVEAGRPLLGVASQHQVSSRAVRAVFGSNLLGLTEVQCSASTLKAGRDAAREIRKALAAANRPAEMEARRLARVAERGGAKCGSKAQRMQRAWHRHWAAMAKT
jgi:hypothetical protein